MKKRIEVIDALRGFSLLGILIANMLHFQYANVTLEAIQPTAWVDKIAFYFTKIFVEGSFYPIFGFLFGYGVILFVRSLEKRDLKVRGPLWRRVIGLILLGILHMVFVWDGDILLMYGSSLLIFMLFIQRKVKTMLIWAAILALCMLPLTIVKTDLMAIVATEMATTLDILKNGSYLDVVQNRIGMTGDILLIFYIVGMMIGFVMMVILSFLAVGPFVLLGMAAAKVDFFKHIEERGVLLKRLVLFIPIGLLCKYLLFFDNFVAKLVHGVGAYMLAIGYMALFTIIFMLIQENKYTQAFTNLGRLSLTNYLMQSIICTTIFYGYGLGYFGELGVALGLLIAVVLYSLQLYLSNLYSKRFSMGPVEWVLRKFVYLGK
ncbi:DUF418 domain-containing protein [Metasolibacillus meyeri]|uniref:DUF418 domain-containing protein n=1 Tax=Metasolibacillus meyeri TaxID=1071052 RepID=A0AAW9NPM4_9BACL|nr:DUF418 domain-containing protein [Metasolibacillus meyeri]MEC1177793.1 DUF418 domain-containing protein [Metasolibacillus meyeri]